MLLGKRPKTVYCKGSGAVREAVEKGYGCPFAFESALITLEDSDVCIELERFLYHVARGYSECFHIYGENKSFEWQQLEEEKPVLFSRMLSEDNGQLLNDYGRGGLIQAERIEIPDYADRLPEEIGRFTKATVPDDIIGAYWTAVGICAHQSAMQGGTIQEVPVFE